MSRWLASKDSQQFLAAELINAGAWAVYPVATFLWTGNPYRLIAGFILALAGVPLTSLLMLAVQLSFMKKIHSIVGKIAGYAMPSLLAMTALELYARFS